MTEIYQTFMMAFGVYARFLATPLLNSSTYDMSILPSSRNAASVDCLVFQNATTGPAIEICPIAQLLI